MPKLNRRPMPPRGQTRIQSGLPDWGGIYRLTVPAPIARIVGPDVLFAVELTEEGILYRRLEGDVAEPVDIPAWVRLT